MTIFTEMSINEDINDQQGLCKTFSLCDAFEENKIADNCHLYMTLSVSLSLSTFASSM